MRRREFFALAGAAVVAWPQASRALPAPVVGFLSNGSQAALAERIKAFLQGLRETGFVDGQSVAVEFRWAEGDNGRLPDLVSELVGRQVSVLVAVGGSASALAARKLAPSVPLVFAIGADPVKLGLVQSFNKP